MIKHSLGYTTTFLLTLLLTVGVGASACDDSAGGAAGGGTGGCASDEDCLNGQYCDILDARCVNEDGIGNNDGDAGMGDAGDAADGDDMNDDGGGGDTPDTPDAECVGPGCEEECSPICSAGEVCVDGACICEEGAERPCGNKAGECRYGSQTCVDQAWTECSGGVQPVEETCDFLDNDCDGLVDEGVIDTFYTDSDGDGVGVEDLPVEGCFAGPDTAEASGDCDDDDDDVYPGADEVCDEVDNDCDEDVDEGVVTTWYEDGDIDGYGLDDSAIEACDAPEGYVSQGGDCDDEATAVHPGVEEICDGVDNDCNGATDGEDDFFGAPTITCLIQGVCTGTGAVCNGAAGWSCDYPDTYQEEETECDLLDNDCDGMVDEGCGDCEEGTSVQCGINIGECTVGEQTCVDGSFGPCTGQAPIDEVCDPDFRDNDCNGQDDIQQGLTTRYYVDGDEDGYGAGELLRKCGNLAIGESSRSGDCDDDEPTANPDGTEVCGNDIDEDCDGTLDNGCEGCDPQVDADFDGANSCVDCDDSNGSVRPGADERCDGIDNDCDGEIDEDFDQDGDGWSVCAVDPEDVDCDDSEESVNPGADELCGADDTGNGVDDNCNGYVDEGCNPCDPNDTDGDGVTECDGDCAPDDGAIYPGAEEVCDGLDNDCNIFTTKNCDVSDPCNFATDNDVCEDDLICACIVNRQGDCQEDYICTSFCNSSTTGVRGDGCEADQVCAYDLLRTGNVHGCARLTDPVGGLHGGEVCRGDDECRSDACTRISGGRDGQICLDFCGADDYCLGQDTSCFLFRSADNIDGRCWPNSSALLGGGAVGDSCTRDTDCDHGFCNADGYCTEPCCSDSDCPGDFHCSLTGDQIDTQYIATVPGAECSQDSDCPGDQLCFTDEGLCAYRLTETAPMCVRDEGNQGERPAGAACSDNGDCQSDFCEATLGICVDVCCSDAACPTGLTCELQTVETTDDHATGTRVCVNLSVDGVLERQ